MGIDRKSVKKMFPNLIKELEGSENRVSIDAVRADAAKAEVTVDDSDEVLQAEAENALPDKFRHYNPTVVDFMRRCDTNAQAEEIISYMQKRGEITEEYACELRVQLKKDGLRSFGPKKEENYYFKEGGLC
ncbi:MAG: DUF2095 domain-containing protein [Candidatus Bathyarchaeota archaeon]|nr:DUF2095 domain-containing protein [Candidatus Bathyarchaeota archaeon]